MLYTIYTGTVLVVITSIISSLESREVTWTYDLLILPINKPTATEIPSQTIILAPTAPSAMRSPYRLTSVYVYGCELWLVLQEMYQGS